MQKTLSSEGGALVATLLVISSMLYVYRLPLFGANVSVFRLVFIVWIGVTIYGILFQRLNALRLLKTHLPLFILLLLINALHLIRMHHPDVYGRDVFAHMVILCIPVLTTLHLRNESRVEKLIRCFIWWSPLALAISIFAALNGVIPFESYLIEHTNYGSLEQGLTIFHRGTVRFAGAFYDPNFYGLFLVFIIIFCCYQLFASNGGKIVMLILVISLGTLVLTMSRTGLIGSSVALIMTVIILPRSRSVLLPLAAVLGIVLIAVVSFWDTSLVTEWDVFSRLLDPRSAVDRIEFIRRGIQAFAQNPFFGSDPEFLISETSPFPSAHVVYLTWLAKYGILGFCIYAAYFYYPLVVILCQPQRYQRRHRYLVVTITISLSIMYLAYDYFPLLEFQYLVFGILYSIAIHLRSKKAATTHTKLLFTSESALQKTGFGMIFNNASKNVL